MVDWVDGMVEWVDGMVEWVVGKKGVLNSWKFSESEGAVVVGVIWLRGLD